MPSSIWQLRNSQFLQNLAVVFPSKKQFNVMLLKQVHLKCIKLYQSRTSKQMLFHVKTRGRHHCVCLRNLQPQQYELSGSVLEENCSSLPVSQFTLSDRESMKYIIQVHLYILLQIATGQTNRNHLVQK